MVACCYSNLFDGHPEPRSSMPQRGKGLTKTVTRFPLSCHTDLPFTSKSMNLEQRFEFEKSSRCARWIIDQGSARALCDTVRSGSN